MVRGYFFWSKLQKRDIQNLKGKDIVNITIYRPKFEGYRYCYYYHILVKFWLSLFYNFDQKKIPHTNPSAKGYLFTLAWCEGFFFDQYMVIITISVPFKFWLSLFCNLDQKKISHIMIV